ncbi:MAG: hypothetical protein ACE5I3_00050 [Phycisphaerae bacterium]
MPHEQERLLALFDREQRWCQDAEARDKDGNPVTFDDTRAAAWDITGAVCLLFGWRRACELFRQLDRHISGHKRDGWFNRKPEIDSLAALQDYNDDSETTYEMVVTQVQTMPVWRGPRRGIDDSSGQLAAPPPEFP